MPRGFPVFGPEPRLRAANGLGLCAALA